MVQKINLPLLITAILFGFLFVFYITLAGLPLWVSLSVFCFIIFSIFCVIVIKKLTKVEKLLEKQVEQNAEIISNFIKDDN